MALHADGQLIEASDQFIDKAERALIDAVKAGDKGAYRKLYDKHLGRVYALCLRLSGDRAIAEEATQEVFIQLWRKIGNYSGQSRFSTWLHGVTSNVCISYMRKQKNWLQRLFNHDQDEMNEQQAEPECHWDLDDYVLRLPERARQVFVLHAIEGYRHEEIASMLNMAAGSSKAQLHRAKQLLKEWMENARA
ncbi:sigma-70 family RNA polymerase sigma factor [Lacimicrobium sp. SS2-24]|uniref:RNA polymerase sigma factor n=1 Tax=Lacimicrobium sp. SS2-24 TaxID=2005569 RepID=UPI000B4B9BBE|nr:sigma-70 family RNA polymerase sigma factor [Lacimicrobium sp. SS2-24]